MKTTYEKVKHQALANMELERHQFQCEKGEKQHGYEIMMMDQQIELERMRAIAAGLISSFIQNSQIDPSFC